MMNMARHVHMNNAAKLCTDHCANMMNMILQIRMENKLFVDKVTNDLSALDYGEASVRLSNYMAALQATQASYVKINDLNLFDRI